MTENNQYLKGRGAQFNPKNRFLKNERVKEHIEAIDDWIEPNSETQYLEETAKGLVNKVDSPDVGMWYSMNPYQGCEHGCTYCYARNAHEYWGYSAGLDFERKIIVKKNAPELLRKFLMNPKWEPLPISLSGNTDCYQPAERRFRWWQSDCEPRRRDWPGFLRRQHGRARPRLDDGRQLHCGSIRRAWWLSQ